MKSGKTSKTAALLLALALGAWAGSAAAAENGETAPARSDAGPFSVTGYFKSFFTVLEPPDVEGLSETQPTEGAATNNLRIKLAWNAGDKVSLTAAYELVPQLQTSDFALLFPLPGVNPFTYRFADLDTRLYPRPGKPASGFTLIQNLDRMYLAWSPGFGDLTVGRQPVAFGSAHVINPTDVLAPFTFQTLDKEERTGVDAVRLRIPVGLLGEFDAGYVLGRDLRWDESAVFIRQRLNVEDTDVTGLVMAFRENLLIGLDFSRSVGGASVWLETAWVRPDAFGKGSGTEYLRASAGADYNLADGLYGMAEYHYNGAGSADPADYAELFQQTAYSEGSVYLLGKHYFIPGVNWQITPLLTLNGQALWNLTAASFFIAPSWSYSFANDVTLEGGAFIPAGRPSEANLRGGLDTRSEYGLYPAIYYASIKVYY